ncbi:DUF3883 domain-containing protein [Geomonas nitrogeniifigens]|uniref:DUF3883 domain-containing protein n=1 Tax=Geomonas diazotrophica TaxID=2843197 RepID=UPI001C2C22E1|nr:DUF3883 domain-containing protein [Geomonas nitrogeniifigens]QXE85551.1 DUF3883 domain-containing protein [Geomonas nitrogeniifigens]
MKNAAINDSWIPGSAEEWFVWLTGEERKTRASYLAKPANLIADYRHEKEITRDYEGREILELLQNAADQAQESQVAGRVVLELLPEGLVVANTGATFSVGGVLSLATANLSPKWRRRRNFIGNKGLGFRSILNWSRSPIILSGALGISYNRSFSERILSELITQSEELADRISEEMGDPQDLILPILPFPSYCETGRVDDLAGGAAEKLILERCKLWREEGYDTVMGMPFDQPNAFYAARKQLDNLRPEILLFVSNLKEVRFITEDCPERTWRSEGDANLSMITQNDEPLGLWKVHRTSGTIPDEKLDSDQKGPLDFEIMIAVPDVESKSELKSSPLFSHFPTEMDLPLPVVCHATLVLNQSRNHTQQCGSNSYVLEQLATFIATVAEIRSEKYPDGPNAGFRLLLPLKSYPNDLTREKFPEQLMAAARSRKVVPTLSGTACYPHEARLVTGASAEWLPVTSFSDVVSYSEQEEKELFATLGVPEMHGTDLKARIQGVNDIRIKDRAAIISGFIKNCVDRSAHSSSLLLDSNGTPVPDSVRIFPSPSSGVPPVLPSWLSLRFLHDELRIELMRQLEAQDVRDLQTKLSSFGVQEYSLANLIRRLIAASNRRKRDNPALSPSIDKELRSTVYGLYQSEGKTGRRPEYPDKSPLPLPNQAGTASPADELYFGRGFGAQGNIVQALFESWAPEKLLVDPIELGSPCETTELSHFLSWLGVAEWPREILIDEVDTGFRGYVLGKIAYPARFEDYIFQSKDKVQNASLRKVRSVDGLNEIVRDADYAAVIAWLALDTRIHQWGRPQSSHAELTSIYSSDRVRRQYKEPLPCYIRWKIENSTWIPNESGDALRPRDCVVGQRAIEALFPRPPKPSSETMHTFGVSDADLLDGWRRSGVVTSLAELELDDIYARLVEMPKRDPEGRQAKALYRWLLDASDSAMGHGQLAREEFIKHGKMWGHAGGASNYYPVSDLRHADSEGLPPSLLNNLKIVDLPFRVGPDKVDRVFGVKAIDRMGIEQRVKSFQLADDRDEDFQKAKPFLYRLRTSQTSQTQHLNALKLLSLKVCFELVAVIRYEDRDFEFVPPVWGWIIENNVIYVRSDPADPLDIASDLLADSVGAAIASIFRIGDGGEFARMFLCKGKDRKSLLKKMRGEEADENMEQIIEEFGGTDALARVAAMPTNLPIREPELKNEDQPTDHVTDSKPGAQPDKETSPTDQQNGDSLLRVDQETHVPSGVPKRQDLKVNKMTGGPRTYTAAHRITDGAFCEKKAMEFEEADTPPRYPLQVGQLTGTSAFGCDILSFRSVEDREAFKSGANRGLDKVLRFIEVKGRKHESGAIELKGNERTSAVNNKSKYFIYRLYKSGVREYQLSILQDPLGQKEALEPAVYVDLNRANETQKFSLIGGIQEMVNG